MTTTPVSTTDIARLLLADGKIADFSPQGQRDPYMMTLDVNDDTAVVLSVASDTTLDYMVYRRNPVNPNTFVISQQGNITATDEHKAAELLTLACNL